MEILDTFFALKNFVKGNISGYDLTDMDPNIRDVRVNSSNLRQSVIYLDFGDEDKFFELMEMDENDVWFLKNINSHYSDYEMIDWYTVKENFLEGYDVFVSFDEDNLEKLEQISKLIYNRNFNLDDDEFRKGLAHKMYDNFNHPTQDILKEDASVLLQEDPKPTKASATSGKTGQKGKKPTFSEVSKQIFDQQPGNVNDFTWGNKKVSFDGTNFFIATGANKYETFKTKEEVVNYLKTGKIK